MSTSPLSGSVADLLAALVRIPSVNPALDRAGQGEAELAAFVADWLRRNRVPVQVIEVEPGRPNVLATLEGSRSGGHLLFETHLDTVGATGMTLDPFAAVREDGRISGRGACDAKGPLAAMLWAVAALARGGSGLPGRLSLAAVMDEEGRSRGVEALIGSGTRWDAAVVGEPTQLRVITCHKGGVSFRIRCTGRAAHSSTPHLGVNAIDRMSDVLRCIRDEIAPRCASRRHPLLGSPTISVGTIRGGREVFTVADECVIEVNRRLLPGEDPAGEIAELRRLLAALPTGTPGALVEVDFPFYENYPLETPPAAPIVLACRAAARGVGADDRVGGVEFGSDAGRLSRTGIPCVLFGPGDIACAHTAHEWIEMEELARGAEAYRRLSEAFLQQR